MINRPTEFLAELAQMMDAVLAQVYGQRMGFFVVMAPFGEEGRADHVCNIAPADIPAFAREFADNMAEMYAAEPPKTEQ